MLDGVRGLSIASPRIFASPFQICKGFSPRNLKYMRAFAAAWPDSAIVQGPLAQITWYHNITLIEKLAAAEERLWYAQETVRNGWAQPALLRNIEGAARNRQGKAQTSFSVALGTSRRLTICCAALRIGRPLGSCFVA